MKEMKENKKLKVKEIINGMYSSDAILMQEYDDMIGDWMEYEFQERLGDDTHNQLNDIYPMNVASTILTGVGCDGTEEWYGEEWRMITKNCIDWIEDRIEDMKEHPEIELHIRNKKLNKINKK